MRWPWWWCQIGGGRGDHARFITVEKTVENIIIMAHGIAGVQIVYTILARMTNAVSSTDDKPLLG